MNIDAPAAGRCSEHWYSSYNIASSVYIMCIIITHTASQLLVFSSCSLIIWKCVDFVLQELYYYIVTLLLVAIIILESKHIFNKQLVHYEAFLRT
jgi:hypothetical protein